MLVVGDLSVELPGCAVTRLDHAELNRIARNATANAPGADAFDAVLLAPCGDDLLASLRAVAGLLRPGGVIIGTAPAGRNRRRIEEFIATVLADGTHPDGNSAGGFTRRALLDGLAAAGLEVRWMRLLRDGWLDPLALRPDGGGTVVESDDFVLRSVPAEVVEELTAEEIVFAAVRRPEIEAPECSVILAALAGADPQRFADALRETAAEAGVRAGRRAFGARGRYRSRARRQWWSPNTRVSPRGGMLARAPRQANCWCSCQPTPRHFLVGSMRWSTHTEAGRIPAPSAAKSSRRTGRSSIRGSSSVPIGSPIASTRATRPPHPTSTGRGSCPRSSPKGWSRPGRGSSKSVASTKPLVRI